MKLDRLEQIQTLFKNALDSVVGMDNNGVIIDWNHQAEIIFGWRKDEVIGRKLAETIIPLTFRLAHENGLKRFLETGLGRILNTRLELTALRKDGTEIPCELAVTPIQTNGSFVFYAFLRDITERKKSEDLLLKYSERVKSIVDNVADGIITINERFQIETWNLAAKNIFGYEPEEVLGKNVNILIPKPFHTEHDDYISNYLTTGRAKIIGIGREVIGNRKDGSTFPMDLAVSEFRIDGQRFFTGVVRDITDRKKAAADLLAAKEAAEAANQAKSAFLANMSHEIRTPLGAIFGFSELLINPKVSDAEKVTFTAAIKRNGELLTSIIDDILDLSRVEAGKMKLEHRETNICEKLADVISLLKLKAENKGVKLSGSCDKNIPQFIMSDPLRIKQILLNIVGNAVKFTERGSVDVFARLVSPSEGEPPKIVFDVKDTGIGISQKQAENLFQLFSQADVSTRRKFGGTGLGLNISKNLAGLLGGDIVLTESTPGKGSTFTITIDPGSMPVLSPKHQEEKSASILPNSPKELRLDGIRVLLAEDSIDNQLVFCELLKLVGAKVDTAENGVVALEKVQREKYDVILMDIQMPLMDGFEATAELRRQGYKTPIIALTAHALNDERQHCLTSGFDGHIRKPIDFNKFVETIARHSANNKQRT